MNTNRGFILPIVLVAMASLSCAQTGDKEQANTSVTSAPELRWKYESGG